MHAETEAGREGKGKGQDQLQQLQPSKFHVE